MDDTNEQNEQSLKVERRPGWEFDVPGELLEIGAKRWTAEQRAGKIRLRCVFPVPEDEKRAVIEAANEGAGGAVTYIQVRNALSEIDGQPIPFLERELIWKALGPNGRQLAVEFWQKALTPAKEAIAKARESFRLSV